MKDAQVDWIREELKKRGVSYGPLFDDLLDHVCTEVEYGMAEGLSFGEAYEKAIVGIEPQGLHTIEERTIRTLNFTTLIRHYLLISLRNLWRNRWYTSTNLLGLTVGLTACMLIFLFIRYEKSYDQAHPEKDLWRLYTIRHEGNGVSTRTAFSGAPWGPALVDEIPALKSTIRFMKYRLPVRISDPATDEYFSEPNLIWADQSALHLFDLPLIMGNQETALRNPRSVVLSESTAIKFFGTRDAIGKAITYNDEFDLQVTGIMKDMPENVHFKADLIGSFNTMGDAFWDIVDNWGILYYYTYFELEEQADPSVVSEAANDFFARYMGKEWTDNRSVGLQKVTDIHLKSDLENELKANSDINRLYLLAAIAGVILLLACANFINLNMARSVKRTREVGVRKVMGSLRWHIVVQFISESFTLVFLATLLSALLVLTVLPSFNQLLGLNLDPITMTDLTLVGYIVSVLAMISFLAGFIPGLLSSRLQTVNALKGSFLGLKGSLSINNGLLLFQFTICTALLIAIGTIRLQQHYITEKDLGYDQSQLLMVSTNDINQEQVDLVKQTLKEIPAVDQVSFTSHKLVGDQPYYASYAFNAPNTLVDTLLLGRLHIDQDFLETYKVELLAGRDFNPQLVTDTASFLVNETTVRKLGLKTNEDALGYRIEYLTQGVNGRYPRNGRIIGVVEDFHFQTLHHDIEGFVMDIQPARYHFYACRITGKDYQQAAASVSTALDKLMPNTRPDYFWLDEHQASLYQAESTFSTLITVAVLISIVLALMGLLSLVLQLVATRRREVGLRKVLGASILSIIQLFSRRFFATMCLSFLIAWPLVYLWMNSWLKQFPYRIDIPWVYYGLAPATLLILALITIAGSTLKTAITSPTQSLRYD
ncbi:hypothetical protein BFP97_05390 [Roseivirga sp. 4D4]|uniref:ABC transporter permease n=1 Tax=Roseivirga sp. 4D4 TaxID=1889784 RepID=UPI000852A273|nr:ABC transporter permease [Roseivirga sp. 4D4]OEK00977.1 hypothetical protein BFP97_05390 [Roseivirga sp. 4D4]